MYKAAPVTVFDDEHQLFGTKVGKTNGERHLFAIVMGKSEEESKENANKLAVLLNQSALK